jgi:DNA-binding NarL/FixJ family response regulator
MSGPARELVLLVDDSPETLAVLTEALEEAGMTVLVARDGAAALALAERVSPDIVLLDAVMPGLDGFETCRRLKAMPRLAKTPVVFMTGLSASADIVRGLEAGGVDYVTKPVDAQVLIARIAVHVANARIIEEAQAALDVAGRAVMAVSETGEVQWASPRAGELVSAIGAFPGGLPPAERRALADWLSQSRGRAVSDVKPLEIGAPEAGLTLTYLGRTAAGTPLLRVGPRRAGSAAGRLAARLGLTPREGEVLAWLADGKSNRDISEILSLSPRTVTKHLEQIYTKLGVENRTAAAAIALRNSDE